MSNGKKYREAKSNSDAYYNADEIYPPATDFTGKNIELAHARAIGSVPYEPEKPSGEPLKDIDSPEFKKVTNEILKFKLSVKLGDAKAEINSASEGRKNKLAKTIALLEERLASIK